MSTATVITEELGPRARRRVRIGTVVALVLLAVFVWWAYGKLNDNGQLEAEGWKSLAEWNTVEFLLEGLWATVRAAFVAGAIATVIGFGLALMRLANSKFVESIAIAWVELFRALPLLFLIFGVFFLDSALGLGSDGDALLGTFWSIVAALVLYNSAVLSEIFRAGVRSLDSGQSEAAKAVGMGYWQMMFLVVLPQAVRRMIPALVAQMATLTKDVSLGFVIGYEEFVRRGQNTRNFADNTNFQAYVVVGIVYFILIWALARLARLLEERQKKSNKVAMGGTADALDTQLEAELAADGSIGGAVVGGATGTNH